MKSVRRLCTCFILIYLTLWLLTVACTSDVWALESRKDYEKKALTAYNKKDFSALKNILAEGLNRYPESVALWDIKAGYHMKSKQYSNALRAAKTALQLKPSATRNVNVGWLYYKGFRDYKAAIPYLEKGMTYAEKVPAFYFYLGECYEKTGQKQKAETFYRKFVEKAPDHKKAADALKRLDVLAATSSGSGESSGSGTGSLPPPTDPPGRDCCFHIWAAGFNMGEATCLLKYTTERQRWEAADNTTYNDIIRAGTHIETAHSRCSKLNMAWPNWTNRKSHLVNLANTFRSNPTPTVRSQTFSSMRATYDWAAALKKQIVKPETMEKGGNPTCAEKYFQLGFLIGYAKQALKISQEWAGYGRNTWTQPVADGYSYFRKMRQVLEAYYLVRAGHCVPIKDLRPKARVSTIVGTPIQKQNLTQVIDKADRLFRDLQNRIQEKCPTGEPETEVHPAGIRFTVTFEDVRYKLEEGGEFEGMWIPPSRVCYWSVYLTVNHGPAVAIEKQAACTFHFNSMNPIPAQISGASGSFYKNQIYATKKFRGKACRFSCRHSETFRVGNRTLERLVVPPGKKTCVSDIFMNVDFHFHDAAYVVIFGKDKNGDPLEIQTPIFTPSDYWSTWKAMINGEPPRYRGK